MTSRVSMLCVVVAATASAQVDTNVVSVRGSRAEGTMLLPSARLLEPGAWELGLGYEHDGEVVRAAESNGSVRGGSLTQSTRWVDQREVGWLHASVSPLSRFELNASLPLLLGQSSHAVTGVDTPSTGTALGDLHLGARVALLSKATFAERGLAWAVQAGVLLPTGSAAADFGEKLTRGEVSTTVTWQSGEAWSVTGHAGYQQGQALLVADQLFGPRLSVGAAFAYRLGAVQLSVDALSNVALGAGSAESPPGRAGLELLAGARYLGDHFYVDVGAGGAPVDDGVTPRWRVQVAFGARGLFEKAAPPADLDTDHDGIPDSKDKCPTLAEDLDGFEDEDGCPDIDDDKDGIPDVKDQCPRLAEDFDGIQDEDGCPETDADHDGIPDEKDKCPLAPEDYDGFEDEDGCPEPGSPDPRVSFRSAALQEDAVFFEVGSAALDPQAQSTLRSVARVMLTQKGQVLLTGHADDQGPEQRNEELSSARAEAVKKLLVEAGVGADRLTTRGAGRREPLTPAGGFGRSLNRSVTFGWAETPR